MSISKSRTVLEGIIKITSYVAGIICLGLCLAAFAQPTDKMALTTADPLDSMTVEQKVGQLMIWSFNGTEMSPELQQILTKYQPGAFIVFRYNIKTPLGIARLIGDMQRTVQTRKGQPLFMMVDQEGGLVTRVRTTTPMPSALALSKMADPEFVKTYGRATADILSLLGFNVDLAPVLDISNPKLDSFIGNRTFGSDPDDVATLTMAYSKGLSEGGLLPTAKHFPGHGGTLQDSHHTMPKKMSTLEQLQSHDLVPFVEFIGADFPRAVMMAHLSLPNVDPSGLPATYSSLMIRERLRQALGYQGLVITDDLEMNGASVARDIGERAVRAFLAGNDMLMVGGAVPHQKQSFDAVLRAVKSGRISRARLDESVTRILAAKNLLPAAPKADEKKVLEAFNKLDQLSKQVMKRNFKIAAETAKHGWPEISEDSRVLVFSSGYRFFKNFEADFKGKAKSFVLTPENLQTARAALAGTRADFVVFFASGSQTAHFLNGLDADLRGKIVVVNCNHEGEVDHQDGFLSVLNINSYFPESATWMAQLLNFRTDMRTPATDHDPGH